MKKSATFYSYLILILLVIGSIFVSCGGDNSGISPGINNSNPSNPTSTPSPEMILKHVTGYVYATSSSVEKFIILDVPATGNESFVLQMADYLQQNYPSEWNKSEIQEIYNQLSSEMSQWKPLVQYNSSAQFFTLYSDSPINVNSDGYFEADVPVQSNDNTAAFEVILNDGEHFSVNRTSFADLITSTGGNSGELKSCSRSVYALPGGISIFKVFASINLKESGLSFSLNDSSIGAITPPFYLKIKGQEIFNIGYGVFKAKQEAAAGMGKTGTITASTSSNGVSGQNIPMPVEIIHETVSISGKVFTDGSPLIDGHVKSIGPKSFCHLDAEGNYVLPEVFEGTNREVIATWWTDESGKRTKHVEIKYIDFLNGNLTDFNFGVPPAPTPTPTLTPSPTPIGRSPIDSYYCETAMRIMIQKDRWVEDLGIEQAVQKTVNWLNGQLLDFPIPQGIAQAKVDDQDPTIMWIKFTDGRIRFIASHPFIVDDSSNSQNITQKQVNKEIYNNLQNKSTFGSKDSYNVKILAPFAWINYSSTSVYDEIWKKLVAAGYEQRGSICKVTTSNDVDPNIVYDAQHIHKTTYSFTQSTIDAIKKYIKDTTGNDLTPQQINVLDILFQNEATCEKIDELQPLATVFTDPNQIDVIWNNMKQTTYYKIDCSIKPGRTVIRPDDFKDLSDYAVIYIETHGFVNGIACGPIYKDDNYLQQNGYLNDNDKYDPFIQDSTGTWCIGYPPYVPPSNPNSPPPPDTKLVIESYVLTYNFFNSLPKKDFSKSLVYITACNSFNFIEQANNPLKGTKAYLGFSKEAEIHWDRDISYYFFLYLLDGYQKPFELFPRDASFYLYDPEPFPPSERMSIQKALKTFTDVQWKEPNKDIKSANPDPHNYPEDNPAYICNGCELKIKPNLNEELYFPIPDKVIIHKN